MAAATTKCFDKKIREMDDTFKRFGITFDKNNYTTISKEKLMALIQKAHLGDLFSGEDPLIGAGYLLIDKLSKDFYLFSTEELSQWKIDGSFQSGDSLYKITFVKKC